MVRIYNTSLCYVRRILFPANVTRGGKFSGGDSPCLEFINPVNGQDNQAYNKNMVVREIRSKTILSVSKVYPYVINPYVGCQHNCLYCYAHFMKRFTGHREPWGQFVDVKVNAPDLLKSEINRKKPGKVWISGVCDPYQPLEAKYKLTGRCLEILAQNNWPVVVQTRSPLVLRDMDIIKKGRSFEVGLSITTADDHIRKIFEPNAPPIKERVRALDELHHAGIKTYVMIAPILPGAEDLVEILAGKVDHVILDRMNYHYADGVYRKYGLEDAMTDDYFYRTERTITSTFAKLGINC
jgi:DNA repair photolyase